MSIGFGRERQPERTPLQRFFLARLQRFARIAADDNLCHTQALRTLARLATLSGYRDCLKLGLGEEAKHILQRSGRQLPSQQG